MKFFNSKNVTIFGFVLSILLLIFSATIRCDEMKMAKQPESPLENVGSNLQRKNILPSEEHSKEKHDDNDDDDEKSDHTGKRINNRKKNKSSEAQSTIQNVGFIHAFFASISVILVSEIGDKTFFIAAIMSMKHPRLTVYSGAISALGLMTLLSALLGNILTQFIPRTYTYYASSFLFAIFGLKMLRESYGMTHADSNEEYEEASSSLRESEEKIEGKNEKSLETGGGSVTADSDKSIVYKYVNIFRKYVSTVFLQAFILTFLAEWGDRSQISTIILGARENMFGTVLGGTIGHALCTGAAVIGGRMIAQRISVKTVTLVGAFVFLFFAFSAFFIDPEEY
jgi:Ca2+/H+ antiporter, TMEM165/GDT1 family